MAADPPDGFIIHARDLEGLESVAHFTRAFFDDVEGHLRSYTRVATRAKAFLESLGLKKIKDFELELAKLSWRKLLEQLFADLNEHAQESQLHVVLIWDEFTYFLSDLIGEGHGRAAMDLLDSLRAARQTHPNIRMLLTGSIGLPEIERRLHAAGHRNRALNDVAVEIVPLFDEANAREVVAALLRGAELEPGAEVIERIIERSEGHPMLIQLLVEGLKQAHSPTVDAVDTHFRSLVEPPGDPLDLRYYSERIEQNFEPEEAELARTILDELSLEPGLTLPQLLERHEASTRTQMSNLLRHLIDDFYLIRADKRHHFRLEFLRRFWIEERGL